MTVEVAMTYVVPSQADFPSRNCFIWVMSL